MQAVPPDDSPKDRGRREFLRDTLFGSLLLTTGALGASLSGCNRNSSDEPRFLLLRESDIPLLEALMGVILGGRLPDADDSRAEALGRAMRRYDALLYHTSPASHGEILDLFDLLKFPVTRIVFAGVWRGWGGAPEEEVRGFLSRWRNSEVRVFNSAYDALVRSTQLAWYAEPDQASATGYPGPPPHARALVGN